MHVASQGTEKRTDGVKERRAPGGRKKEAGVRRSGEKRGLSGATGPCKTRNEPRGCRRDERIHGFSLSDAKGVKDSCRRRARTRSIIELGIRNSYEVRVTV